MKKNISIIIGILYCLFVIWNRLIRERFPRDIFTEYSNLILFAYFLLFFSSLYIIIYSLREIFNKPSQYKLANKLLEIPIFEKIFRIGADIVINYILKGPINLYEYLYKKIKIRPFVEKCCELITRSSLNENLFLLYLLIVFKYSFYIIVVLIFGFEVFYYSYLKYFYKFLLLLIFPLFIDLFLFIIYHLSTKNKKIIEEWIEFPPNEKRNGFNMRLKIENKDNPFFQFQNETLRIQIMQKQGLIWYYYGYSCMTIEHLYLIEKKYKKYIYLFIYTIYAVGWGYILFKIFTLNNGINNR